MFFFLTNSWYSWPQNYIKLLCCLQNCMTKSQHESKNIHPCPKVRGHGTQQHVSWFSVRGPAEATTRNPGFGCGNLPPSRCHQQVDVCMPLPGGWKQRIWQLETYEKSDRHSHEIYRCTKKNIQDMPYICIDMPLIHLDVFCFESLMDRQDFVFFWKLAKRPPWPKDLAGTMFADAWGDGGVPWWRIWVTKKPGYFVV